MALISLNLVPCRGLVRTYAQICSNGSLIHLQVPTVNGIFDEEEPCLYVLGTLGAGYFFIPLQQNGTLFVLVHNVLLNSIPLGIQEVFGTN